MKNKFMTEHPLRKKMTEEDWQRVNKYLQSSEPDDGLVSCEEYEAANDVFFDAIAIMKQTHAGSYTLQ
jgi:hypothetical protein